MMAPGQIFCVIEPVDMRRGMESLSQWIQTSLGTTPCDGTADAFSNRSKTRLKLLIWDGTGVWCWGARLAKNAEAC
ncbi:IS66 family insertion sequence element accessory protein TnpB [Undibacterium sp. SXout11W]|uniref:IS66 family insertion sequence element accessory protein TnpB n=1 Tax=Undibacterium sp. SXout11W TaxID=3413050 RepID=UPI003BF0C24A